MAEWKTAYFLHKAAHRDPRRANGMDIAQMAIYNNAALAEMFFSDLPMGKLVEGAAQLTSFFVDPMPQRR